MKIILASKSGVRKEILDKHNIENEVIPEHPEHDEEQDRDDEDEFDERRAALTVRPMLPAAHSVSTSTRNTTRSSSVFVEPNRPVTKSCSSSMYMPM